MKVALLEDDKFLLKDLKKELDKTGLVEVVAWSDKANDFIEKVQNLPVDAVLLDIDLAGDTMSGLDVANYLKLPVLFISGKTGEYFRSIEELNVESKYLIDHLTKPITSAKLKKMLEKFIGQIKAEEKSNYVYLDFYDSKQNKISINTIVYLCSDKEYGAASNNKRIFFTNRKPETLVDFSFVKMEEKGLHQQQFIQTHKSYRVNEACILKYDDSSHEVEVKTQDSDGKPELKRIPVSENFRKFVIRLRR